LAWKRKIVSSIDRNGVSTTNQFDALDRLVERRLGGLDGVFSGREVFQYGARGLTNYFDALTNATRFVRDELGRVQYQTNANIEVLGFTYNPADQLLTLTDGKQQTTRWNYDGEGRVTNKVDALNAEMFRYQYDPDGQLTNRWQAGNVTTTFRFDAVGNLTNVVYPAGTASITLGYDPLNRLTNLGDGIGTTAFAWTDGNQLASEDGPWANDTVSFGYGARLRTSLSVQQPNASAWAQSYGHDEYWRLTNVTSPAGAFVTQYKSVTFGGEELLSDLVQRVDLPGGSTITNAHDGLGRLLATVLQNSALTTLNSHQYQYNGGHQRTKQTFTAGNFADYTYDNIGQLKTAKGKESGGATRWHEQMGYAYDAAWNLSYRTNNTLTQTLGVDALNQLTTATRSGNATVAGTTTSPATNVTVNTLSALVYGDSTFARTNVSVSDGDNTFTAIAQDNYGRADTNTITAYLPATATFHYDARGNLTNDGRRILAYDAENQLVSVTVSNAWRSEFQYDGFMRRRIRKEFSWTGSAWSLSNEVRYIYDGRLVVQERDANNLAQVSYTRGNDLSGTMQGAGGIGGLLARSQTSDLGPRTSALYHSDGNGNITALVSTNQLIVARYHYDPYGNTLSASGPLAEANLYRFSSTEFHANAELYYYGYRYYAPNLQRWVNRDPLGERGGVNLQSFVRHDPLSKVDRFGLIDDGFFDINDNCFKPRDLNLMPFDLGRSIVDFQFGFSPAFGGLGE
jgi:RHS repeat-associated protein